MFYGFISLFGHASSAFLSLANENTAHTHIGWDPLLHIHLTMYMCKCKHTKVYTTLQKVLVSTLMAVFGPQP